MPAGQWVAFEGYDTIHDCKKPPKKKTRVISISRNKLLKTEIKPYEKIGIPYISIDQNIHIQEMNLGSTTSDIKKPWLEENKPYENIGIPDISVNDKLSFDQSSVKKTSQTKSSYSYKPPLKFPRSKSEDDSIIKAILIIIGTLLLMGICVLIGS
jgi:hypothetical protein